MENKEVQSKKYSIINNLRFILGVYHKQCGYAYYGWLVLFLIAGLIAPFMAMAMPSAMVSYFTSHRSEGRILMAILMYVLVYQVMQLLYIQASDHLHQKLFLFRCEVTQLEEHSLSMEYEAMEKAEKDNSIDNAVEAVYTGNESGIEAFLWQIIELLFHVCGFVLYSYIVGRNNPVILLLIILFSTIVALLNWRAERLYGKSVEYKRERIIHRFYYLCRESINLKNAKDIRIYHAKDWFLKSLDKVRREWVETYKNEQGAYNVARYTNAVLAFVRDVIIYGFFIWQMSQGQITLPSFMLYIGTTAGFNRWVNGIIGNNIPEILRNNVYLNKYRRFLDYGNTDSKRDTGTIPYSKKGHEIRLEDVCFHYPDEEKNAIRNVNLTIKQGEKLALVGVNGAGKSTLIKLICGLYRPSSGKIYMDGVDISNIPMEEYYKKFSVVFQEVFTFSFPLSDNVTCQRKEDQDRKRLQKALKDAGLLERVNELPKREQTPLNKEISSDGIVLSGGELQKLMLARALYKDSPIVILDEPTAALDPIAESNMYEKYNELTTGKTSIYISHRLSSTRFCDRIIFLGGGVIIEEGTHHSLMEREGEYAKMFGVQAHYYQKKIKEEEEYCYE